MSITVDLVVTYSDTKTQLRQEALQGVERDLIYLFVTESVTDYKMNTTYVLKDPSIIEKFAALAAKEYPLVVESDLAHEEFTCVNTDQAYVPLFMPLAREHRFLDNDPAVKEYYYNRYALLFNEGKALFGARLVNIESIEFCLNV